MRLTVTIDDAMMAEVLKVTGLPTKRAAVELGLRRPLDLNRQGAVRALRGKLDWQGQIQATRADS